MSGRCLRPRRPRENSGPTQQKKSSGRKSAFFLCVLPTTHVERPLLAQDKSIFIRVRQARHISWLLPVFCHILCHSNLNVCTEYYRGYPRIYDSVALYRAFSVEYIGRERTFSVNTRRCCSRTFFPARKNGPRSSASKTPVTTPPTPKDGT